VIRVSLPICRTKLRSLTRKVRSLTKNRSSHQAGVSQLLLGFTGFFTRTGCWPDSCDKAGHGLKTESNSKTERPKNMSRITALEPAHAIDEANHLIEAVQSNLGITPKSADKATPTCSLAGAHYEAPRAGGEPCCCQPAACSRSGPWPKHRIIYGSQGIFFANRRYGSGNGSTHHETSKEFQRLQVSQRAEQPMKNRLDKRITRGGRATAPCL